jgi:hypothetical protein
VDEILKSLAEHYTIVNMREHARAISQRANGSLRVVSAGA